METQPPCPPSGVWIRAASVHCPALGPFLLGVHARRARKPGSGSVRLWQPSGLENGRLGAHIRIMERERYEARALGWRVVRINPNGTETTVEVWPEEKAKHRAAVLDQRAAESFEAEQKLPRKGRDE